MNDRQNQLVRLVIHLLDINHRKLLIKPEAAG